MNGDSASEVVLRSGDLIPDHALTALETDEFKHEEIAERVADLLTTADPPLNVALFGPWGSGKSSFATLLKKALTHREMKTKFVVYNAWKYSGEALQRSFISETAKELGVEDAFFTHQLAQTVERTQLDLKQVTWKQALAYLRWVWRLIVPVSALVFTTFAALISLLSVIANRSVSHELLRYFGLLSVPVMVGLLAAVSKLISDSTKTRVQEGPPTEERFEKRFKDLLEVAKGGYKRFVFFIDELDRVSPGQVVKTLSTIKNFLDQENAVFIVAADKDVLEQAFKKLPQANPANEDEPYYSSSSEFLDKIFQHQLTLPPLRGPSLFRFAHDLVAARAGGIWDELKNAEPDARLLDRVLYVLIPSHARSPRRVKVLLNNFATNVRIAQSRGVDWMARAREIAKLTVLQTEFPLFAADLHIEPRLPSLILDSSGRVVSERTRRLLNRHGLGATNGVNGPSVGNDAGGNDASEPPEPVATAEQNRGDGPTGGEADDAMAADLPGATGRLLVPPAARPKLVSVQQENLRRYLIRTIDVRDPSRELLFLEPGGVAEGLTDPELGELLEAEAIDNPSAVVAAARERTKDEQQAIAIVLAGMSEQAYSEERSNIVTALLDVVHLLDGEMGQSVQVVSSAVASFARSAPLDERHLTGALLVGIAEARATGNTALRDQVLADERLLEKASNVWTVSYLIDDLPSEAAEDVRNAIAAKLPETTDVLSEPLCTVSPESADGLLRHGGIREAVQTLMTNSDAAEAEGTARFFFDTLARREVDAPIARLRLMQLLTESGSPSVYPAIRDQAEKTVPTSGTSQIGDRVAIAALLLAPPEDWRLWLPWVGEEAEGSPEFKETAEAALIKVFGLMSSADNDELDAALELAPKIVRYGRLCDDDVNPILSSAVQLALQARAWWSDVSMFDQQEKIHAIARAVGSSLGPSAIPKFAALRHEDLLRAAASSGLTMPLFLAIARWAVQMEAEQIRDLATRLSTAPLSGDQASDVELVAARTHLWMEARGLEEDVDEAPYDVDLNSIVAVGRPGGQRAQSVVVAWMDDAVDEDTVQDIITGVDRSPAPEEADAFRIWFFSLKNADERTDFLIDLASEGGHALDWLGEAIKASPRDYSEEVVAHSVVSDAMKPGRAEKRRAAVDALIALNPHNGEAQREVGRLIVWLLGSGQKVDFEIAVVAVRALGTDHGMGRKIGIAFRKQCEHEKKKIPHRQQEFFEAAGIVLGPSYFDKPKKGPFSRLLRR